MLDELILKDILVGVMAANGILAVVFGFLANDCFRRTGSLSIGLALWSGGAMHGHAVMTFLLAWQDAGSLYSPDIQWMIAGGVLMVAGVLVIYLGRKAYGDVARVYGLKEDMLITAGIYSRSRNPQYLGYFLLLGGVSVLAGSVWCFVFTAVFAVLVHAGIVLVEEPQLKRKFGSTFEEYAGTVSRYFG